MIFIAGLKNNSDPSFHSNIESFKLSSLLLGILLSIPGPSWSFRTLKVLQFFLILFGVLGHSPLLSFPLLSLSLYLSLSLSLSLSLFFFPFLKFCLPPFSCAGRNVPCNMQKAVEARGPSNSNNCVWDRGVWEEAVWQNACVNLIKGPSFIRGILMEYHWRQNDFIFYSIVGVPGRTAPTIILQQKSPPNIMLCSFL